jgi:REP element-mobilizing transposase RayT
VGQAFLFGDEEKRKFRFLMRQWADFSGLSILTHCLMDNHFHLLLWVPPFVSLSHSDVVHRLQKVWPEKRIEEWEAFYQDQSDDRKLKMLEAVTERMSNLPEFMRVLKQSFSRWYNQRGDRRGTLWDSRYRSVVVEENPLALMSVGSYIDLNPVRAGICKDPASYVWSGFGQACQGDTRSQDGVVDLVRLSRGYLPLAAQQLRTRKLNKELHWNQVGSVLADEQSQRAAPKGWADAHNPYRIWLYAKGGSQADNPYAKEKFRKRKGFDPLKVVEEFEKCGQVPIAPLTSRKRRSFSRGVAMGSPGFLEALMQEFRSCFGENRKKASRKMKDAGPLGLGVLRQVD